MVWDKAYPEGRETPNQYAFIALWSPCWILGCNTSLMLFQQNDLEVAFCIVKQNLTNICFFCLEDYSPIFNEGRDRGDLCKRIDLLVWNYIFINSFLFYWGLKSKRDKENHVCVFSPCRDFMQQDVVDIILK